jgi:hypothetical protein
VAGVSVGWLRQGCVGNFYASVTRGTTSAIADFLKGPKLESRKKNDLSIRWKNHQTLFQVHPRDGLKGPSIVISSRHEVAGSFKAVNQPAQCIAKSFIQLGTV